MCSFLEEVHQLHRPFSVHLTAQDERVRGSSGFLCGLPLLCTSDAYRLVRIRLLPQRRTPQHFRTSHLHTHLLPHRTHPPSQTGIGYVRRCPTLLNWTFANALTLSLRT